MNIMNNTRFQVHGKRKEKNMTKTVINLHPKCKSVLYLRDYDYSTNPSRTHIHMNL